jgi:predicted DNA-binding protein YlxM (UPF0122 family)
MKIKSTPSKTKHPQNNNLAKLYLDANNPEAFAEAVFGEIRKRAGKGRGLLRQKIDEVESTANCLFEKYLNGNSKLHLAITAKNRPEISEQIERTMNAVVQIARKRTLKKDLKDRHIFMADLPDVLVQHPYRLELADLPVDIKKEMVRLAVEECREELGHKTADLLSEILERSCPMAEVARDSGVTRQAIHIRLAPAIKKIRKKLESMEIPNLDQL